MKAATCVVLCPGDMAGFGGPLLSSVPWVSGQVLHATLQTYGISTEDAGWESLGEALWFAVWRDESLMRF